MSIGTVKIGNVNVSRLIIGGNPFSGFSHQSIARDDEMKRYYTVARIKETLRRTEQAGLNTHLSRADHHVMRYLMEYWDEGGTIQWFAQTCPEIGSIMHGVNNAIKGGAKACHLHGGMMDRLFASRRFDELPAAVAKLREAGLAAGIAGHNPQVFEWAEESLDVDYYACSYYNPTPRDKNPEHVPGSDEWFRPQDRQTMVDLIQRLSKPVIHYKVLAAGRTDPAQAMEFVARYLRPQDAVCVGVYLKDFPHSIEQDKQLLEAAMKKTGKAT